MTTLFLFAHQDDEIGVFHTLAEAKRRGERVACVYLTNGAWAGVTSAERNRETAACLIALGLERSEMMFLGTDIAIPDGGLIENLDRCFETLCGHVDQINRGGQPVRRFIMHAWEGGHHDHDAAHLLGLAVANTFGLIDSSRQFPLYRSPSSRFLMTFAKPLPANGKAELTPIPIAKRLTYLRLLGNYRSQARVMFKLFPHIAYDYARYGVQRLQPVSLARASKEPNTAPMLYETWKLYSYAQFRRYADPFIIRTLAQNTAVVQEHPA